MFPVVDPASKLSATVVSPSLIAAFPSVAVLASSQSSSTILMTSNHLTTRYPTADPVGASSTLVTSPIPALKSSAARETYQLPVVLNATMSPTTGVVVPAAV